MQSTKQGRLTGIESLRAYAAVAIVFFHLIHSGGATVPEGLGFVGTHFGMGVPLFFVVSGFSLAYGYWGKLDSEQAVRHYFRRRFFRIAPLFYFMLAFQLINIRLENNVTLPLSDVLLNLVFLFNLLPHLTDGIVPASWTIGVEMLFYLLFPALLFACTNLWRTAVVLGISIGLATQFSLDMSPHIDRMPSFVYHNFVTQLPFFLWGIACFHLHAKVTRAAPTRHWRHLGWACCALAVGGLMVLYHAQWLYILFNEQGLRTAWDTLWGVPFGLLCLGMALHPTRLISNPVTRYLGMISFSLYLVHPTILYRLGQAGFYRWIYAWFPGHEGIAYLVCLVISLALITAVAGMTFHYIERPGMAWGKRVAPPKAFPVAA